MKTQPFDSMLYFYGKVQTPRIRCLIRLKGHISESTLIRAVDLSIGAVPLLRCIFDEQRHCWIEKKFSGKDIVHLTEVSGESEYQALSYLLSAIDHTAEPQLKIWIIRDKQYDTLCVIINHMVCDGAGFKEYLYLLCGLYSKCEENAGYNTIPNLEKDRSLHQVLRNFSGKEKLRILLKNSKSDKPDPAMAMPLIGDLANPFVVVKRIAEEPFGKIRSACKSRNASVNDALLTAYMRALSCATGCKAIAIPCPVDLRKFGAEKQRFGLCNLTGNYWCSAEIPDNETFEDTLEKVSAQMQAQKNSTACLKAPMLFQIMYRMLPFRVVRNLFHKVSPPPVISFTNVGILDYKKLCLGSHTAEDAFISTAIKKAPYFQLTVSSCRGHCVLSSSQYGTENDGVFISGFLDEIIRELTEFGA